MSEGPRHESPFKHLEHDVEHLFHHPQHAGPPEDGEPELPEAVVHSARGGDTSDFQPVCAYAGMDFGYPKATEGTSFLARTFPGNFANLKGRVRGAYHFYHPSLNAIEQAHFFWSAVSAQHPEPGDFLVADIEIMVGADGGWYVHPSAQGRQEVLLDPGTPPPANAGVLTNGARLFLDTLSSLAGPHHPVLVYTNQNVGSQLTSCTGYDLIIAFPSHTAPASVAPWKTWRIWQWGAGNGPCGGDADAYNGTKADMLGWQAKFKPDQPTPPPHQPTGKLLMEEPMLLNKAPADTPAGTQVDIRTPLSIPHGADKLIFTSNAAGNVAVQFTGQDGREGPFIAAQDLSYAHNLVVPLGGEYWTGAVIHRNDAGQNDVSVAVSS